MISSLYNFFIAYPRLISFILIKKDLKGWSVIGLIKEDFSEINPNSYTVSNPDVFFKLLIDPGFKGFIIQLNKKIFKSFFSYIIHC